MQAFALIGRRLHYFKIKCEKLGGKMGITFSITVPEPLERKLRLCAKEKGMSRSRFIGDILSKWDEKQGYIGNTCIHQDADYCRLFNMTCTAPEQEALTCEGYYAIKKGDD